MEENKNEKETPPAQTPQAQTQQSASPKMRAYFDSLRAETKRALESATAAREKALDAETEVEVFLAPDLASRVEGLVGPTGVAERVRALSAGMKREEVSFGIAKEIMDGGLGFENATEEKRIEQAVRTGLAVFTEGVVSAPIEGVSQVRVRKNSDGSRYLAIYFAGPIRGAGGTGQAMTLLLGDYCRKLAGLENYRPLGDVVERYVEECNLYALRTRVGQYQPTEEEVRHVVTNCPVCINGEPTEDYEVGVHKNVEGIDSNRVRGGVYLVISEGVCLKASKVMSIARKLGLDWSWLERLIKVAKQEAQRVELKPTRKYMDEIVGGRPIFAHPMRAGGFRLRYGRTRFMGIQAKAIHPASMEVLDEFPAFGTQLKTERPGKACIVTPCSAVEPPVVLFEDGEVKQINSVEEAIQAKPHVKKILFLGDLLVSYGDFKQTNHPLAPSAWCEEWMQRELQSKGIEKTIEEIRALTFEQAQKLALETGVPLAPKYTFFWSDLTLEQLKRLAGYLGEATLEYDWFEFKRLRAPLDERKEILEMLCVPHAVREGEVVIEKENALALLETLSLLDAKSKSVSTKKFLETLQEFERSLQAAQENPAAQPPVAQGENHAIAVINSVAPFKIRAKTGLYIGASMGRPEKSRPREMKPPVHALFPIGWNGGKTRDIARGVRDLKQKDKSEQFIEVEASIRVCVSCKKKSFTFKCGECGGETIAASECATCGGLTVHEGGARRARGEKAQCKAKNSRGIECGGKLIDSGKTRIDLVKEFTEAAKRVNFAPSAVKGVVGLISLDKTVEPLEKGILRSKHEINVFRDGTVRFDATEIPLTHFTPDEIGVSVEEAKRLGYDKDYLGKPLESGSQTVELFPQDVVLSKNAGDYLLQISRFVDDLLAYHYEQPAYYNAKTPRDLLGQVVIVIAPHTSAGIVARVIGFTDVQGMLAHPYLHCATRRNCLHANTILYYKNDERFHTGEIARVFEKYAAENKVFQYDGSSVAVDLSKQNVFAFGANEDGEFREKKIKRVIKRKYSGKMLKITTKSNHEAEVTPEHLLWVFENGKLREKQAKLLTGSDFLTTLDSIKPSFANPKGGAGEEIETSIDLISLFEDDYESENITVRVGRESCAEMVKRLGGFKKAREALALSHKQASNYFYRGKRGIPIRVYKEIKRLLGTNADDDSFKIGFKRNFGEAPAKIKLDAEFAKLLGYYASEGWTWKSKTKGKESFHIGFAAKNDEVRAEIAVLVEKVFGVKPYVYKNISVSLTNKLLYKLFKEKLCLGSNAYEKNIHDFCFEREKNLVAFLSGLYQGDGSVSNMDVRLCTVSQKLAAQTYFALVKLGLKPTFKKEVNRIVKSGLVFEKYAAKNKTPPATTLHYVCLYSSDAAKFNELVELISTKKTRQESFPAKRGRRLLKCFNDVRIVGIKSIEEAEAPEFVYDLELEKDGGEKIFACGKGMLLSHNCDGDEDGFMLLMDAFLNFSRHYLPASRGGQMDAPLVLIQELDPSEIDREAHSMEACTEYPLEFYEATQRLANPSEVKLDLISTRLGTPAQFEGIGFTHSASIEGPLQTKYVQLKNMRQKVEDELDLMTKIRAVDAPDAAERLVLSHFFPDLYGNLRRYSKQSLRCVDCNARYRRAPLVGKCLKCGGRLLLTVSKASAEKYLKISQEIVEKYNLPVYLKQRLMLLEKEIEGMFEEESKKQFSLANYL